MKQRKNLRRDLSGNLKCEFNACATNSNVGELCTAVSAMSSQLFKVAPAIFDAI